MPEGTCPPMILAAIHIGIKYFPSIENFYFCSDHWILKPSDNPVIVSRRLYC